MSEPSGIDMAILMDAACDDQCLAIDLMKLFFELTGQEQIQLADAVERRNGAVISSIAHKLAGSCAACGISGLAARFREMEQLCKKAIPEDIGGQLLAINHELQEIRLSLETHFNCSLTP